jgi:hypothetical protein
VATGGAGGVTAACPDCGGESAVIGGLSGIVHAFSCKHRHEGDPARCDYSKCRSPLPHDKVVKDGKKTCDEICRAKAWKERVGYGRLDQATLPSPPVRTPSHGKRKGSGRQVSYLKAVDGCTDALVECGVEPQEAILLAEKHMRRKLSAKQLAELEASEQEEEPEPATLPLPAPTPLPVPVPEPEPDLPPAAEDVPHVTIFQRQRDDRDAPVWVEVDRMPWRGKPEVALTVWLDKQDPEPLPGGYRAEGNGGHAETVVGAEAA